jgi:hypothetical protein
VLWLWSFMFCFESIKHTTEIGGCFVFLLCFKFGFLHLCACSLMLVSLMMRINLVSHNNVNQSVYKKFAFFSCVNFSHSIFDLHVSNNWILLTKLL